VCLPQSTVSSALKQSLLPHHCVKNVLPSYAIPQIATGPLYTEAKLSLLSNTHRPLSLTGMDQCLVIVNEWRAKETITCVAQTW